MGIEKGGGFAQNAFLGEKARNVELVKKIDETAEKVNQVLNPIDDVAKRKVVGDSIKLIRGLGIQVDNVTTLNETLADRNKTQAQKENAEEVLDVLAKGVYVAMRYGENEEIRADLCSGSVEKINDRLPEPLKGLGERVRANIIDEPQIVEILDVLDKKRVRTEKMGNAGEELLKEEIKKTLEKFMNLTIDSTKEDQLGMVIEFLGVEAERLGGEKNSSTSDLTAQKGKMEANEREIPRDLEGQLRLSRIYLEKVESSVKTTRDVNIGAYAARLEEMAQSEEVFPEVAIEIRSRLKLHDSYTLMRKANGYIEAPESGGDPECPSVGMAATLAEGMGHALDNEAIGFFLKSKANGIPTEIAWDMYQKINCYYVEYLNKLKPGLSNDLKIFIDNDPDMGRINATYYTDSDPKRKKMVDESVVEEIIKSSGVDSTTAKKAWELAKKLATATGENSVFNAGLIGNDQMAEDIYLKLYRKGRDEKGRPRGPQITLNKITGIGNSWLRQISDVKPFNDRNTGEGEPLYAKDIVVESSLGKGPQGIQDGSYVYHFGVWWSAKIHPLRNLLLDRQPSDQKIINIDTMQKAVDYFNKADPDKNKKLRQWWVAGILDLACSYANLGWTQDSISKFGQYLTMPLSNDAGPFLKKEDWNKILREGKFVQKMLKLELKAVFSDYAYGPGSSGRGGKR